MRYVEIICAVTIICREPEEASLEAEESQLLGSRVHLMSEEFEAFDPLEATALSLSSFCKRYRSSYETPSPSSSLTFSVWKMYRGISMLIEDTEGESSEPNFKREGSKDESLDSNDEREIQGLNEEIQGLDDEAASEPLGLGYEAARHHTLESTEEIEPSRYKVGKALAVPVQTPPSPEWSLNSLPISPSSPIVPSPIASLVATLVSTISVDEGQVLEVGAELELYGIILYDHTQRLDTLSPTLFEGYDRDLRLILALEAWAGQTDAQRAALWHAIYDILKENHDLRRQLAEERRERLELTYRVARIERRQESGGE
nr:hypothetical protein [Tanacetum cinerariifolium]